MTSIEYYGFLLIFLAGAYFALRFALSASRSVGGIDAARRGNLLRQAVAAQKHDDVKGLLAGAVDLEARDERGDTLLMLAVRNNDRETVRLLLAKGADVFAEDRRGQNAWELAAALNAADGTVGFYAQMLRLLESGRDFAPRLLLAACRDGDVERARHALAIGAPVDSRDYFVHRRDLHKGATALMLAVEHGRIEVVRLLVDEGADIHFSCGWDDAPDTALEIALASGQPAIVEYLLLQSARRRAVTSGYGAERRIEKRLLELLDSLPVIDPAPPGLRRNRRQMIAALHEQGCAEILQPPWPRDPRMLDVLLGAARIDDGEGEKLSWRWLEIQRVGSDDFVCNEYETVGPVEADAAPGSAAGSA